ncbi:MAG: hypothetical protein H6711_15030 [Myxococcales bacterium]|nr:hypothetical protein [Myxococcales bacterium]
MDGPRSRGALVAALVLALGGSASSAHAAGVSNAGVVAFAAKNGAPKQSQSQKNKKEQDAAKPAVEAEGAAEATPPPPPPPPPPALVGLESPKSPKKPVSKCMYAEHEQIVRARVMADAGWGVFAASYLASAITGLLVDGRYFVPIVGPYIAIPDSLSGEGVILGLTLGTLQLVSLPIAITGTVRKRILSKRLYGDDRGTKQAGRRDLRWSPTGLTLRF